MPAKAPSRWCTVTAGNPADQRLGERRRPGAAAQVSGAKLAMAAGIKGPRLMSGLPQRPQPPPADHRYPGYDGGVEKRTDGALDRTVNGSVRPKERKPIGSIFCTAMTGHTPHALWADLDGLAGLLDDADTRARLG